MKEKVREEAKKRNEGGKRREKGKKSHVMLMRGVAVFQKQHLCSLIVANYTYPPYKTLVYHRCPSDTDLGTSKKCSNCSKGMTRIAACFPSMIFSNISRIVLVCLALFFPSE